MADTKISELPAAGSLSGVELAAIVQGGVTKRVALSVILALLVDAAPGALDTLNELAAALGDDANFAASTAAALAALETPAGAQAKVDSEATARATADALLLPKAGGTLTGALVLSGDAASALQATPLQQVQALIAALVDSSPSTLNTLNELAEALGDDPNFAATTATLIGEKVAKSLYDAFTVLAADVDNVPAPVTMAANTVLARLAAGGIVAATPAQLRTLLGTGTTDATTVLHGNGTWAPPAGGGGDLSDHLHLAHARIYDDFERADAGALGTTVTGDRTWATDGSWSIVGGHARNTDAGYDIATLAPHHEFGAWQVTTGPGCASAEWYAVVRYGDSSNYIRVGRDGATNAWLMQKIEAAAVVAFDFYFERNLPHAAPAVGDVVTIVNHPDDGFEVFVNGVLYFTGGDDFNSGTPGVGLAANGATPTFASVSFVPIGGAPDLSAVSFITTAASGLLPAEAVLGTSVIMRGLLAARPAAGTPGRRYIVTNDDGGTEFHDTGASWVQVAPGLTEAPAAHGFSTHGPGGSDSWTRVSRLTADSAGVISSTALVNSGLSLVVAANEVWEWIANVFFTSGTTGDCKFGWSIPAGMTGKWGAHWLGSSEAASPGLLSSKAYAYTDTPATGGVAGGDFYAVMAGIMVVGATPGTVHLQYAQRALEAVSTVIQAHSYLRATRLA